MFLESKERSLLTFGFVAFGIATWKSEMFRVVAFFSKGIEDQILWAEVQSFMWVWTHLGGARLIWNDKNIYQSLKVWAEQQEEQGWGRRASFKSEDLWIRFYKTLEGVPWGLGQTTKKSLLLLEKKTLHFPGCSIYAYLHFHLAKRRHTAAVLGRGEQGTLKLGGETMDTLKENAGVCSVSIKTR